MKNSFVLSLVLLFLFAFSTNLTAQEGDTLTSAKEQGLAENLINNISSQVLKDGFSTSWILDYDEYQTLKEKGYSISIRYQIEKSQNEDKWETVNGINLQETSYSLTELEGGKSYVFQIGVVNGIRDFWSESIEATTDKGWGWFRAFILIGSLGMFIYGMKIMSEGLQRAAGSRLRYLLGSITSSRFKGVLTGFGITALIQSSSVTSVMTVSFVNAGLLTLTESVAVMMGTNIGTTITGWVVNYFGFEVDLGPYSLVLIAVATPMLFFGNAKVKAWSNAIIGFSLLFMGLSFLNASVPQLGPDSSLVQFFLRFNDTGYLSIVIFALFGLILTVIVQSSSAALALIMTLVAGGIIPFDIAAAMIIGGNVGTTVTAEIAATIGNVHAKRAARINTIFNSLGAIVAIILFPFLLNGVEYFMNAIGTGNPFENAKEYGNTGLAILHTGFNLLSVSIFIWFVPNLVRLAERTVKSKGEEDEEFHLDYIGSGYMSTPNLSLLEAKKEIAKFGEITSRMSKFARELLFEKNKKNQKKLIEKLAKYEELTDRVEVEVANYLNKISEGGTSLEVAVRIQGMNKIVNELERIGDIFYQISKDLERKIEEKIWFTPAQRNRLAEMFELVDTSFLIMCENLTKHSADVSLIEANAAGRKIVEKSEEIRREYFDSLSDEELNMNGVIIYNNIYVALKRVGSHIVNVSEGVKGKI